MQIPISSVLILESLTINESPKPLQETSYVLPVVLFEDHSSVTVTYKDKVCIEITC